MYTNRQYTEQHSNTENTVRNIQNNKNTTEVQHTHDKSYFNLRKINQKWICFTENAQPYKRWYKVKIQEEVTETFPALCVAGYIKIVLTETLDTGFQAGYL